MTQTSMAAPHAEAGSARGMLSGLRQDLFTGAFASRPLPPLPEAGPSSALRRVPVGIRQGLRWIRHWVLGGGAALIFLVAMPEAVGIGPPDTLLALILCLLLTAPIALVLFRPVGAFWISLAGFLVALPTGEGSPWADLAPVCHLIVMVSVVLRTRPRTAPEMWLLTIVPATFLSAFADDIDGNLPFVALFSAVVLVAAAAGRAWHEERRHVVETETVTAKERAHRTLLEERALIARELHDVVAHHMSVIAIQAEAAPFRVKDTPPELAGAFTTIRENAVAALTELRRILGLVRADDPDTFAVTGPEAPQPTLAALDTLLEGVREAGLEVDAVITGAPRTFPQGVELSAYRLVQEALSNALRHSPGAKTRVEISYVLGGLGLRVVNGRPERPVTPSPGSGHGLLGMRERVQLLGGEMTADPTEEGGFEVLAFVPVTPDAPAPASEGNPARGEEHTARHEGNPAWGEGAA
ncbi:histidine kinase [Streptomyces sp. NBC_01186]|uniref:sensor histidine kinase n=1 Tax=Streptomyces sp. NBC_01186 TaxID=2903765 RepID=UPI002E1044BD|nr:histidine kinase [Streptomyces sp. NBC_01186]